MSLRWVVASGLVALATVAVTASALAWVITLQYDTATRDVSGYTPEQLDAHYDAVNTTWLIYSQVPWLASGALLAVVATLALVAFRAQRAASASATASREA